MNHYIPGGKYYLPFSLVLISESSRKFEYGEILQSLLEKYTIKSFGYVEPQEPLEHVVNRIVFGIPKPVAGVKVDVVVSDKLTVTFTG